MYDFQLSTNDVQKMVKNNTHRPRGNGNLQMIIHKILHVQTNHYIKSILW